MELATTTKEKSRSRWFNPNPIHGQKKKHDVGDCVVRACCKATGLEWDTVFKELCEIGMELKAMPNDNITYTEYLKRHDFIKHTLTIKKGSKRPTVASFAKEHKTGTFFLRVANHVVACVEGLYYDTWDPGECSLYTYWEKAE